MTDNKEIPWLGLAAIGTIVGVAYLGGISQGISRGHREAEEKISRSYREAQEKCSPKQVYLHDFDGDSLDDVLVVSDNNKYLFISDGNKNFGSRDSFVPFELRFNERKADGENALRDFSSKVDKSIDDFLKEKEGGK